MANNVYQYEQPRCPDNWNESERRFYARLIQVLDDIYGKYGRIDEKMLSGKVIERIDSSTEKTLEEIAGNIAESGKITVDTIEATYAYVMSLTAKYGNFDFSTIKNLVSSALVINQGQAGYVHITNLAATYAQMVNATIGNLVIKSSDGGYYQLNVDKAGKVTAEQVAVSDEEILAGATDGGRPIVGTNISAVNLDAETVAASLALFNQITAEMINVQTLVARDAFIESLVGSKAFLDKLWADEAFIAHLNTADISNNSSISIIAGDAAEALKKANDATSSAGNAVTIAVSAGNTANTAQSTANTAQSTADAAQTAANTAQSTADAAVSAADAAAVTAIDAKDTADAAQTSANNAVLAAESATELAKNAVSKPEFVRVIRIDLQGLHVGDNLTSCEVLIDSASVNVVLNGQVFSSFAANYVEFGSYQLRRTADGGLAFKMR